MAPHSSFWKTFERSIEYLEDVNNSIYPIYTFLFRLITLMMMAFICKLRQVRSRHADKFLLHVR